MANLSVKTIKPKQAATFLFLITFLVTSISVCRAQKAYRIGPNDVLSITIHAGGEKQ